MFHRAEEILDELKQNSKVKFKETDLFRVYQSIDLVSYCQRFVPCRWRSEHIYLSLILCAKQSLQGNLSDGSELAIQMPALMKLKRAIYSPEYRAFVERVTGLEAGTLTDEVRLQ